MNLPWFGTSPHLVLCVGVSSVGERPDKTLDLGPKDETAMHERATLAPWLFGDGDGVRALDDEPNQLGDELDLASREGRSSYSTSPIQLAD